MTDYKSVLITGATSGIGQALAAHYLAQGAQLIACGRNEARLSALYGDNPGASWLAFDIADYHAAASHISERLERTGGVDLAILNAGDHQPTNAMEFLAGDYARLMRINYIGALNCLEPLIQDMTARKRGTIALMGSVAGYTGLTYAGAYCASKSALMRLAETMRVELAASGVDVRLISPGFVKTPLTDRNDFDMPFLMETEQAVSRIARGLAGTSFEIAFPRRLVWSLRLLSALPKPLYFALLKQMLQEKHQG